MKRKQLMKIVKYDLDTGIFYNRKSDNPIGQKQYDGYIYIWIGGNKHRSDELAWFYVTGERPKYGMIHLNGVNSDNWLSNLKPNKKPKQSISGIPGVHWNVKNTCWRVQMMVNNNRWNLGNYDSFDDAVLARYNAEKEVGIDINSPASLYVNKVYHRMSYEQLKSLSITGVTWEAATNKWRAKITINYKQKYLGNFDNFDNAVVARFKAELEAKRDAGSEASNYINKLKF